MTRGNKKEDGFSLIEILFAFVIFVSGVLVVLTLLIKNISLNKEEPNRLKALLLADEALTIVHNIRDTNVYHGAGNSLDTNLGAAGFPTSVHVIGYNNPADFIDNNCTDLNAAAKTLPPKLLPITGSNTPVRWNSNIGYYQINNGTCGDQITEQRFLRLITITDNRPADKFITVTVQVSWDNWKKKVELSERLYENL